MDWQSLLFSFRGRINRAKYWLAVLVFVVADAALGLLGWVLDNGLAFQILSFVVNLAVLIASIAVCIKRLHDRDRSGWWLLLFYAGPVASCPYRRIHLLGRRRYCRHVRGVVVSGASALPPRRYCAGHLGLRRDRLPARHRGI